MRFFSGAKRRHAGRFFLEQKIGVMCGFFWSRKSAAAIFLLQQNSQICMQIG